MKKDSSGDPRVLRAHQMLFRQRCSPPDVSYARGSFGFFRLKFGATLFLGCSATTTPPLVRRFFFLLNSFARAARPLLPKEWRFFSGELAPFGVTPWHPSAVTSVFFPRCGGPHHSAVVPEAFVIPLIRAQANVPLLRGDRERLVPEALFPRRFVLPP